MSPVMCGYPIMPGSITEAGCCVLDLDGTLVDSLGDIAAALNHCLELLGLETFPIQSYRYMVGEGVPKLCERALGQTHPHLVGRLAELVRPYYRTRVVDQTRPYPGVVELVERLRSAGVRLAVLSNKPHELTVRVVRTFWPNSTFDVIQGYLEEQHRKPSPYYLGADLRNARRSTGGYVDGGRYADGYCDGAGGWRGWCGCGVGISAAGGP